MATAGNTLGAWSNWLLGRYCLRWQGRRWFPVGAEALARAGGWFKRYGSWSLLLSWLPVVGDPLTMAAGLMGINVWLFLALVGLGKAARYLAIAQGVALFS
ncbi:MAG: VTT domain-containing protein [Rhodospirillales bacterium]|nr:VTT domain-containing protein [Rhodospirillales bacterium]